MTLIDPTRPLEPTTYIYRQHGYSVVEGTRTEVPETGSMVVDATPDGTTQVWRRYIDPDGPASEVTQRWTPDGVWMVSSIQRQLFAENLIEISCRFSEPMLVVPWPIDVGSTHTGVADCGVFEAVLSTTVVDREPALLANQPIDLWVIESTLESPAPFRGFGRQRDWVSWELGTLFVRQQIELEFDIFGVEIYDILDAELVTDSVTLMDPSRR